MGHIVGFGREGKRGCGPALQFLVCRASRTAPGRRALRLLFFAVEAHALAIAAWCLAAFCLPSILGEAPHCHSVHCPAPPHSALRQLVLPTAWQFTWPAAPCLSSSTAPPSRDRRALCASCLTRRLPCCARTLRLRCSRRCSQHPHCCCALRCASAAPALRTAEKALCQLCSAEGGEGHASRQSQQSHPAQVECCGWNNQCHCQANSSAQLLPMQQIGEEVVEQRKEVHGDSLSGLAHGKWHQMHTDSACSGHALHSNSVFPALCWLQCWAILIKIFDL